MEVLLIFTSPKAYCVKKKKSHKDTKKVPLVALSSLPLFSRVLGYLSRNALDTKNLIKEIKAIASIPTERHFFNVSDEADLLEKAGTIGNRFSALKVKSSPPPQIFFQPFQGYKLPSI